MKTKKRGFTIIEIIIAIGIIAIILPPLIGAFINVMREYTKAYAMKTILENSSNAIETLKSTFKKYSNRHIQKICENGFCTTEICTNSEVNNLTSIFIYYADDNDPNSSNYLEVSFQNNTIKIYENNQYVDLIDNSRIEIENFNMKCIPQTNNSLILLEVSFTAKFKSRINNNFLEENASLPFYTLFKIEKNPNSI